MFGPHVDRIARGASAGLPAAGNTEGRPPITARIRAARAAAAAVAVDARAFQIFVAGPRNMAITLRDEEADELRQYLAQNSGLEVIAHGTYADYPWYGNPYPAEFIRTEIEICARAGISGLVIRLGEPDVDEAMKYIPRLAGASNGVLVFLEPPPAKPAHYGTPEKLARLFQEIRKSDPTLCRFGLCIDTAHLWSCGVDLQSFESAEDWIRRLEMVSDVIPPGRIIFHLNDSFDERGGGVDRPAPLLGGNIWKKYRDRPQQSGLAAFINYITRNNTTAILERAPEPLLDDYAVLGRLAEDIRL